MNFFTKIILRFLLSSLIIINKPFKCDNFSRISKVGSPPRFFMKGDDDTYYNIPLIHKTILQNKEW
jgi:hypothetical protein